MFFISRLPYILLMAAAAVLCGAIAFRAYKVRLKVARARPFFIMAMSTSLWMLIAMFEGLSTTVVWKEIWWRMIPFVILGTLTGLFLFALEYSLRLKRIPRLILVINIAVILIVTAMAITNHIHHLFWTVDIVGGRIIQVYGSFFYIQLFYTYLLALSTLVLLARAYLVSSGVLRRQAGLMLVGILVPVVVSVAADVWSWDPLPFIDEPAFSTVVSVVLFSWATFRFNVFYLLPVAYDLIIKNMQDGVLVTDVEGQIFFSNPAVHQVLGKSQGQLSGQPVAKVLAEWLPDAFHAWEGGKRDVQLVINGTQNQFFRLTISNLAGNSGELLGHLLTLYDNSEQKDFENQLQELAISDPLTGCYNRRYFYEMAHTYFNQMQRSTRPLSILMIDLDHFKNINDTYGHSNGDLVLQRVVAVCKSHIRAADIFARYGGEEFVLALPETGLQEALLVAERLRGEIASLGNEAGGIPVTASIGVVAADKNVDTTFDMLLNRADEAMYRSKSAGRNRVTVWEGK
jgi:diguanylate cyclase (GGDEF)-like protein/PAS domain S-box-containing protein